MPAKADCAFRLLPYTPYLLSCISKGSITCEITKAPFCTESPITRTALCSNRHIEENGAQADGTRQTVNDSAVDSISPW